MEIVLGFVEILTRTSYLVDLSLEVNIPSWCFFPETVTAHLRPFSSHTTGVPSPGAWTGTCARPVGAGLHIGSQGSTSCPHPWKNCLPRNGSLAPKRLGAGRPTEFQVMNSSCFAPSDADFAGRLTSGTVTFCECPCQCSSFLLMVLGLVLGSLMYFLHADYICLYVKSYLSGRYFWVEAPQIFVLRIPSGMY